MFQARALRECSSATTVARGAGTSSCHQPSSTGAEVVGAKRLCGSKVAPRPLRATPLRFGVWTIGEHHCCIYKQYMGRRRRCQPIGGSPAQSPSAGGAR